MLTLLPALPSLASLSLVQTRTDLADLPQTSCPGSCCLINLVRAALVMASLPTNSVTALAQGRLWRRRVPYARRVAKLPLVQEKNIELDQNLVINWVDSYAAGERRWWNDQLYDGSTLLSDTRQCIPIYTDKMGMALHHLIS